MKANETRSEIFSIRVTPTLKKELQRLANKNKQPLNFYLDRLLRKSVEREKIES